MNRVRRLLIAQKAPQTAIAPVISVALLLVLAGVGLAARHPKPLPTPALLPAFVAPAKPLAAAPAKPLVAAPAPQEAAPFPLSEQQRLWLNQDVGYIITSAERTTFKALRSYEERYRFIEQFWLRRDPKPGTPENEFKEEHYRRIAYANERYFAGLPGWKTDRGRVYIVCGPPDEIESHPSGTATEAPFEVWSYRSIEGIGENTKFTFRDPTKTNEYRLVRDRSAELLGFTSTPQTAPSGSPENR